jgi:hypothetical protein
MASAAVLRFAWSRSSWGVVAARGAGRVSRRGPFSIHRPRDLRVAMTLSWSQPAWQRTSTLPSSASRIDKLGSRSSWVGQRATQPFPALRPPRAVAMASAFITGLFSLEAAGLPASFARERHSALDHSVSSAKNPMTFSVICRRSSRLRSRPMRGCQIWRVRSIRLSFAACDGFNENLTGGSTPPMLLVSGLGFPPMTLDRCDLHLVRPHRRDRLFLCRVSAAVLPLG